MSAGENSCRTLVENLKGGDDLRRVMLSYITGECKVYLDEYVLLHSCVYCASPPRDL
jgi:hypothetical protein